MTYAEFKTFIMTHLWKMGDQVVIDNLDTIIMTAEAELNRMFKMEDRSVDAIIIASNGVAQLPVDCREVRHITEKGKGGMKYVSPHEFYNSTYKGGVYTTVGNTVKIGGDYDISAVPAVTNDLLVTYYRKVTKFKDVPNGPYWLADDYFDVYLYSVLKHTAPFLREDERLQTWGALYNSAMEGAIDENQARKFAGSPLKINFGRTIR